MRNIKYNHELSIIDTEEKAYLLGQIYGDGCCTKSNSYKVEIASIDTDIELYKKLSKIFPFLTLKRYNSHANVLHLVCGQKALYEDLVKLGMKSNKVKNDETLIFHFPELQDNLIHHFIRGYFDADGSVYTLKRKRSRNSLRTEFGCSTKNFLLKVHEILKQHDINFTYYERFKTAGNGKLYHSCTLLSSSRDLSQKFADYIYKDATIYLQRKYDLFHKEKDLRPTAFEEFGECPYCKSHNVIRCGVRHPSQRLHCLDCDKRFSRP